MKNVIVGLVAAGLAGAACGQAGWVIAVNYGNGYGAGGTVNPGNPSAKVRISAKFSPNDYAVAGVNVNVSAGDGSWSNNVNIAPMTTGSNPGTIVGSNVNGIIGGQLNFPAAGIFANPANPIHTWEATWSTGDFTLRTVALSTRTVRFDVYADRNSPSSGSRMSGLMEGSGGIDVVPAPSALALLGLGGLVAGRRRR